MSNTVLTFTFFNEPTVRFENVQTYTILGENNRVIIQHTDGTRSNVCGGWKTVEESIEAPELDAEECVNGCGEAGQYAEEGEPSVFQGALHDMLIDAGFVPFFTEEQAECPGCPECEPEEDVVPTDPNARFRVDHDPRLYLTGDGILAIPDSIAETMNAIAQGVGFSTVGLEQAARFYRAAEMLIDRRES